MARISLSLIGLAKEVNVLFLRRTVFIRNIKDWINKDKLDTLFSHYQYVLETASVYFVLICLEYVYFDSKMLRCNI